MLYENVIIGFPLIKASELLARDEKDYSINEFSKTFFTNIRFLPKILKEIGLVQSTSEIKRNRPDLWITLNKSNFLQIKWRKQFVYIVVGEKLVNTDSFI